MRLLLDADAASKLAHWGLLEELPGLFSINWDAVATLESVKHRARSVKKGTRDKLFCSPTVAAEALVYLEKMADLPTPSAKHVAMLENVPRIDGGEVILLAVAAVHQDTYVITGDKKAMSALGKFVRNPRIQDFDGRCICLEFILLQFLNKHGVEWLRKKICPFKELDKSIGAAMGSNCDAPEAHVKEGLQSYLADLMLEATPIVQCSEYQLPK